MKYSGYRYFEFSNAKFENKPNYAIGIRMDARLEGNSGKWSINNVLLFTPYSIKGVYLEYVNEEWYTNHTAEIGVPYTRLNNMLSFRHTIGKSRIIVFAGITNGTGKVKTNKLESDIKYYVTVDKETDVALDEPDSWELEFNAVLRCLLQPLVG